MYPLYRNRMDDNQMEKWAVNTTTPDEWLEVSTHYNLQNLYIEQWEKHGANTCLSHDFCWSPIKYYESIRDYTVLTMGEWRSVHRLHKLWPMDWGFSNGPFVNVEGVQTPAIKGHSIGGYRLFGFTNDPDCSDSPTIPTGRNDIR